MPLMDHLKFLAQIGEKGGKVGGKSRSRAKVKAAKKNVAKAWAARRKQRKYPKCIGYNNGSHRFRPDGCCYSPECRKKHPNLRKID